MQRIMNSEDIKDPLSKGIMLVCESMLEGLDENMGALISEEVLRRRIEGIMFLVEDHLNSEESKIKGKL